MNTRIRLNEKTVANFIQRAKGRYDLAKQLPRLEKLLPPHIRSFSVQNEEIYQGRIYWEWSCVISCRCAVCFAVSLSTEDSYSRFQKVIFDDNKGRWSRNFHYEEDIVIDLQFDGLLVEQLERAFSDGLRVLNDNYLMNLDLLIN